MLRTPVRMAMEKSKSKSKWKSKRNPGRCTLMVGLNSADQVLRCLMLMTGVAPSAVLVVKNGGIQILSSSATNDIYASVEMDASFAASWGLESFAIQFNLSVWIELLKPFVAQQGEGDQALWIYKIGVYPGLYCLVGNDSTPVRLGVAEFVEEKKIGWDAKFLRRLASNTVKVHMTSECLREVITNLASSYNHVGLMVMNDRVAWHTVEGEFTYDAEDGDCVIEGVEEGTARYMVVEWRYPWVLHFASRYCYDLSMCCSLIHQDWMGWIRFSCLLDGILPFMFLMQGSNDQVYL